MIHFDPSTRHSVPTLNELSEEQLAELRTLANKDEKLALRYLCHLVERCHLAHAESFTEDILFGGQDPRAWGRGDRLVLPSLSLIDNLSLPLAESLAPLREFQPQAWARVKPSLAARPDGFGGAPGALVRSQPYWYVPAPAFTALVLSNDHDDIEPISELDITARRWLASRLAHQLRRHPLPRTATELAQALRLAAVPSRDAMIAVAALHREEAMPDTAGLPGFRGPDAWFRTQ